MVIINPRINPATEPVVRMVGNQQLLFVHGAPNGIIHYSSATTTVDVPDTKSAALVNQLPEELRELFQKVEEAFNPGFSFFFLALHDAYREHIPIAITPQLFWYAILYEVALHVKAHPNEHTSLFTGSPGVKTNLNVRDDSLIYGGNNDWAASINLFEDALRSAMTDKAVELFLPRFSTMGAHDHIALLLAFMDIASPYYEYGMSTMCGIPEICLEGTVDDWQSLLEHAILLSQRFQRLSGWFSELLPVLGQIAKTATGEIDYKFWESIYKIKDGSGGPYSAGWITTLLAHLTTDRGPTLRSSWDWGATLQGFGGLTTNQFPSHISSVPMAWNYMGQAIPMKLVGGAITTGFDGKYLRPGLGFAVLEMR